MRHALIPHLWEGQIGSSGDTVPGLFWAAGQLIPGPASRARSKEKKDAGSDDLKG